MLDQPAPDFELPATGGWNVYKAIGVGSFTVPAGGKYTLSVHAAELKNGVIMNLRRVVLRPVPNKPGVRLPK